MEPFNTIVDLVAGRLSVNQVGQRLAAMNPIAAFLFCVMVCSGIFALIFASISLSMAGFVQGNVEDGARNGAIIGAVIGVFAFFAASFLET